MTLEKDLLIHLNNNEESFEKRVQIADNAFKSPELPVQCKVIVLKWILSVNDCNKIIWDNLLNWFSSSHFKDIARNEIETKDIKTIIDAIVNKISSENIDNESSKTICTTVVSLIGNKIFEQYFKHDLIDYLNFINCILHNIQSSERFLEFLNSHILYKNLLTTNEFIEAFVSILLPELVTSLTRFDDKQVFVQVSRMIQKSIFGNKNTDQFALQVLLKHLSNIYEISNKTSEVHFRLVFQAFVIAYQSDSTLIYKLFLILCNIIGFSYEQIPVTNPLMSESGTTHKSYKILLSLLTVLEESKLDLSFKVNEVSLSDLLKTILTESVINDKPSKVKLHIVKITILLDPSISQTLIEQILSFVLLKSNDGYADVYEELMLAILDLFSKLHRTENLISKLVAVLNNNLDKLEIAKDLKIENILTTSILNSYSKNIQSLASWQVINVFKTFLYALKTLIEGKAEIKNDKKWNCFHMEFLSELVGAFLSSIRVAEHTVAANVVEKTKKCLNELEQLLHLFGTGLLNRKHNCSLMRSFLNIAFHWAEMNIILRYYSGKQEEVPMKPSAYNLSASNVTYTHPYLTIEEWCLISERITNFGEIRCKQLLHKLFVQKVRAMHLFEQKVSDEVVIDLSRYLTSDLENNWKDILGNKFLTNTMLPSMDADSKNILAEKFVGNVNDYQKCLHIFNNTTFLNAVVYYIVTKCDKIVTKQKRKLDEDLVHIKRTSTEICKAITLDQLHNTDKSVIKELKKCYYSSKKTSDVVQKFNESKLMELLEILKKFPLIFCQEQIQHFFILYLFALHKDINSEFIQGNYKSLQKSIENLIIGVLQQYKFRLSDIFQLELLCQEILNNFDEWKITFNLVIDNIFKYKDNVNDYESLITHITDKLQNQLYMHSGIIIINTINKLKKVKMPKEIKIVTDKYRSTICDKIFEIVVTNKPVNDLIPAYTYALKFYLAQNDEEKIPKLIEILDSYTNVALQNPEEFDKIGYLLLFNTILQNKSKIKSFSEDLPLKIWNVCKSNIKVYSRFEEYSQLILLIICYIPNEEFNCIVVDLLNISEKLIDEKRFEEFSNNLKTWESVLTSNINPIKTKTLQEAVEKLLSKILINLDHSCCKSDFYESLLKFQITIVKTHHFHLTPALVDILLLHITVYLENKYLNFELFFNLSVSLLSNLLKYRKSLIMDRLPPYLQQYRSLLKSLCKQSDSDVPKDENLIRIIADCAYQLEKLTKNLVDHQKDMSRISMYLIADILEQYEKVTIFPNVKMHLNNCIYSLITVCDQHAVSYLMRVLSSASTEIFKVMYENYKKYYRFTGKAYKLMFYYIILSFSSICLFIYHKKKT